MLRGRVALGVLMVPVPVVNARIGELIALSGEAASMPSVSARSTSEKGMVVSASCSKNCRCRRPNDRARRVQQLMARDVSGSPGQRNIQGSHRRDVNRVVCRWAERPAPSLISRSITTVDDGLIKVPEPKGTLVPDAQRSRTENGARIHSRARRVDHMTLAARSVRSAAQGQAR